MLRKKQLLESIANKLSFLELSVRNLNALKFFDANVASEDFFVQVLNIVYGYKLVNLNHEGLNQAAIDLGDTTKRIGIQVTSERTKAKIQSTLNTFVRQAVDDQYKLLKVLIIGKRTGKYETLVVPASLKFCGTKDVIDIPSLLKDIQRLGTGQLTELAEVIDRELSMPSGKVISTTTTPDRIPKQPHTPPQRTPEIQEKIAAIGAVFENALQLQQKIRTSPSRIGAAIEASEEFGKAASLIEELIKVDDICHQDRVKLEVLIPYYRYESKDCMRAWYYEEHRCKEATEHYDQSMIELDEYIDKLVEAIDGNRDFMDVADLQKQLEVATFKKANGQVTLFSIHARLAFDSEDYIKAIDYYTNAIEELDKVLLVTEKLDDGMFHRIASGNKCGFLGNINAATNMHLQQVHNIPGLVSPTVAGSIIRLALEAYKEALKASRLNPEWEQYLEQAESCRRRIVEFVEMNQQFLPEIWAEFHDEIEFVKILKSIDPTTTVRLELGTWRPAE